MLGVLGQQINLAFAYALKKQFVEGFGDSIEWNGKSIGCSHRTNELHS